MLTLPSLWNLLVSTFAFFIAAWYLNRFLNEQGIRNGMTRGILVFVLAALAAWGTGELASWSQDTLEVQPSESQDK